VGREHEVLPERQVREKRIALGDVSAVAPARGDKDARGVVELVLPLQLFGFGEQLERCIAGNPLAGGRGTLLECGAPLFSIHRLRSKSRPATKPVPIGLQVQVSRRGFKYQLIRTACSV
jgi:hypothetical protein